MLLQTLIKMWETLHLQGSPEQMFRDLAAAYRTPTERSYHNLEHINDCLNHAKDCGCNNTAILLAILVHDAVYDPTKSNNEEASVELLHKLASSYQLPAATVQEASRYVLATKHTAPATEPNEALIQDIDLAGFGAAPEIFDGINARIRQEYAHVPEAAWCVGRTKVLQTFLERSPLYLTPYFFDKYEKRAKANLKRTIRELKRARR